jgi:hypothetical protein
MIGGRPWGLLLSFILLFYCPIFSTRPQAEPRGESMNKHLKEGEEGERSSCHRGQSALWSASFELLRKYFKNRSIISS